MKTITNSNQWMQNAKAALLNPIPVLALILALTACTNQELPGATDSAPATPGESRNVTITATLGSDEQPQTRLGHETDPNGGTTPGVIVKWSVSDAFKLYPGMGDASEFEIKAASEITNDGKTATFTGSLAGDASGAGNALYPATAALNNKGVATTTWASITLGMEGQKQTGNDSYAHLSAYDYMTASVADVSSLPTGNDLDFHHLAAMMTLKITGAPTGYTGTTDNAPELLTLTAGRATDNSGEYGTFRKTIKADGSDSDSPGNAALTSSINLMLDGITWDPSGFTAHLMMLPTDLSGKTFTVSVRCKDGTTYRYTTPQIGKAYVKGMRYTATIGGGNDWTKATDETQAAVFDNSTVAAEGFASGSGTQTDPYIIATAAQLKYFQEQVNASNIYSNKYIRLDTDIKIDEQGGWTPIGLSASGYFKGYFDGGGHTIYGTMIGNGEYCFGFFGYLKGNVSNLHIAADVKSAYPASGEVVTGGVAGYTTGANITGCSSSGTINGGNTTGGIVGHADKSSISCCIVRGEVKSSLNGIGSIGKSIEPHTGGIVGRLGSSSLLQSCTNTAVITGSLGKFHQAPIATGTYTAYSCTGGIAGYTGGVESSTVTTIRHCCNKGKVTVAEKSNAVANEPCYVGGLIGQMDTYTNLSDSENHGAVAGGQTKDSGSHCGGLVGVTASYTTVTRCTNRGTVTGNSAGTNSSNYTGGLVGNNIGTLHLCLNTLDAVVIKGNATTNKCYAGGLVGLNDGMVYDCCTNAATVDGATASNDNRIGGYYNEQYKDVTHCEQGHTSGGGN